MKLPFLHKNNVVLVNELEVDDWFRMGGETYRITFITTNNFGQKVIHFVPYDYRGPESGEPNILVLDRDLYFGAYNKALKIQVTPLQQFALHINTLQYSGPKNRR